MTLSMISSSSSSSKNSSSAKLMMMTTAKTGEMMMMPRMWWFKMVKTIEEFFIALLLLVLLVALLWTTTQYIDVIRMAAQQDITGNHHQQNVNDDVAAAVVVEYVADSHFKNTSAATAIQQQQQILSRRKRFVGFPEGSSFSCAICLTTGVLGNPNYQWLSLGLNWGIAYELPNSTWIKAHAMGFGKPLPKPPMVDAAALPSAASAEPLMTPMPYSADGGQDAASAGADAATSPVSDAPMAADAKPATADAMPATMGDAATPAMVALNAGIKRRHRRDLYHRLEVVINNMGYNGRDCILRALCESRQYFQRNKLSMIGEMLRVVFSLPKQRIFTRELNENADIKLYDHAYRKAFSVDCQQAYDCSFSLLELALGQYSRPPPSYHGHQQH